MRDTKKVEIFVVFLKVLAPRWRVAVQSTNPDNPIGKPRLFLSAIYLVVYQSSFSFTDNLWQHASLYRLVGALCKL